MSGKKGEAGNVPSLRFPEFQDTSGWEENTLDQACIVNPAAGPLPDSFVYIDLESVEAGVLLKKTVIAREGSPSRAQRLLKTGDVLFQMVRPYQKNNLFFGQEDDLAYVASTGYAQLRAYGSAPFLFHCVHTDAFVDQVMAKATGSNYPAINSADLAKIPVDLPKEPEQQKIADCLSSIDEVIAAQTQKLDALKAHKKGLMQQLFPAEGETVPKLRFPEFRDAPEWREQKAGKLFAQRTDPGEPGLPIYSVTMNDGMVKRSLLERRIDDIEKPESNKKAYKGDIAYNMMRMWQGAFGVVPEDCMVSPAYVILAPRNGVLSEFIAYMLKLPKCLQLLTSHSQGLTSDRLRLYFKDFAHITLSLPSFSEQEKIALALSSLDELIVALTKKIDALRAHKKGLMQQLFPSPDETCA